MHKQCWWRQWWSRHAIADHEEKWELGQRFFKVGNGKHWSKGQFIDCCLKVGCACHTNSQPCVWDYTITKNRENKCVAKRRINCTTRVCGKNAVDWASNYLDTPMVEGSRVYAGKKRLICKTTYLGGGGYNGLGNEILTYHCESLKVWR